MEGVDLTTGVTFHGVEYVLAVSAPRAGDTVTVELEHETDGTRWVGTFAAKYVEEITRKTGNFKRFPVFLKMLVAAVNRESDSVFIDLLTYADLEMLRARKEGRSGASASSMSSMRHSNRRYLILTYAVEWDRVHYPLQLTQEEKPSPEALQRTIARLRKELASRRAHSSMSAEELGAEVVRLQRENDTLHQRLRQLSSSDSGHGSSNLQAKLDAEVRARKAAERALESQRTASRTEIHRLRGDLERLRQLMEEGGATDGKDLTRLRRRVRDLTDELASLRETNASLKDKTRDLTRQLALKGGARPRTAGARRSRSPGAAGRGPAGRRSASPGVGARRGRTTNSPGARRSAGRSTGRSPARSTGRSPARSRASSSRSPTPAHRARGRSPGAKKHSPRTPRSRVSSRSRSRSLSPGRFDPTAYEAERQRRLAEAARRRAQAASPQGRRVADEMRRSASSERRGARASTSRRSAERGRPGSAGRAAGSGGRKPRDAGLPPRRSRSRSVGGGSRGGSDGEDSDVVRGSGERRSVGGRDQQEPQRTGGSPAKSPPPRSGAPLPGPVVAYSSRSAASAAGAQSGADKRSSRDDPLRESEDPATRMSTLKSIDQRLDNLRAYVAKFEEEQ